MKVLLIYPPFLEKLECRRYLEKAYGGTYSFPLGLAYIASMLIKEGYNNVEILDTYVKKMSWEQISRAISQSDPQIIGISCLSDERATTFKLISLIKSINEKIKIVLGGPHPSLMYEQIVNNFPVDAVVIGEGEYTFVELVKTWESGHGLHEVKGIAFKDNNKVIKTAKRERIKNLDELPFPAYDLVDLNAYKQLSFVEQVCQIKGLEYVPKSVAISSSRGCVGSCNFCSAPGLWKRKWIARSASSIVDEIEMLHKKYNISFFVFVDDIFSVDQKRVIEMSDEIINRKLKILWGFETAVRFVSLEMLERAKAAGCSCIFYGIESGSENILYNVSKNILIDTITNAFDITRKTGMICGAFLMVGNIGENRKSISKTMELLRIIKPDIVMPQIAMLAPGTGLYETAKKQNVIDDNYWLSDNTFPYYTYENNLRTLLRWYRKISNYNKSDFNLMVSSIRDALEFKTGIRISRRGVFRVSPAP
jgi:radical SAM superfamily enzyme YgiQ (UPF0313 family)